MLKKIVKVIILLFFISLTITTSIVKAETEEESIKNFSEAVKAVEDKEYTLASDLFEPLAINGDIDAQYNLSILIRNGLGRPQNFMVSLKWAWLSYTGGFEKAKSVLIDKLITLVPAENLEEIRKDVSNFILKFINEGDRPSLNQMGKFYLEVLEEPNYEKAYLFYSISVAFGDSGIKTLRDELLENIDSKNIVNIQSITNDLFEILRQGDKITLKQLEW